MKYGCLTLALLLLLAGCSPDRFIRKGNEAASIGEWYEASLWYGKAYTKIPLKDKEKRGEVAYKVGDSNRRLNYVSKALAGYRNAARYGYTDTLTYFYLAEMERIMRDYKGAAADYNRYLQQHPGHQLSLTGLQSCAIAPEIKERGSSYSVRIDRLFNSHYDDYSPVLQADQIFFTSTRKEAQGDDINGVTGMKSGDLFTAKKDQKGHWQKPEALPSPVNSQYDEGACAFSPDGKTMYFTRCRWDANYPRLAEIYSSSRSDASWSEPQLVQISHDTLTSYAHPAVSPDGRWLYFVSNMAGGQGGLDLWRAELTDYGIGTVENLGPEINTKGNEVFPTFRPNGDLYFSSNGRPGLGGLDIYKATLDTTDAKHPVWHVTALPSPVNSSGDDFGMTFDGIHNRGYLTSNRANRRGWDMIYTFECPEVVQSVKGWVYEQDGYELPKAVVYMVGDDGTNLRPAVQLDGSFQVAVKPGVKYIFLATCDGYMNYSQELQVPHLNESHEDTLQFPLPSANIPVLVHNVFYDFNKATIKPSSIPALNGLVNLLKQNPSIAIELSSHCDYRGSQEYNQRLSQHRAEAVVDYLTSHGIAKNRVVARGYGKLKPKTITGKFAERYPFLKKGDVLTEDFIKHLSKSKQDTCNALNRRTEFSVLKTTYGLLDKHGNLVPDSFDAQNKAKAKVAAASHPVEGAKVKASEAPAPKTKQPAVSAKSAPKLSDKARQPADSQRVRKTIQTKATHK